MAQAQRSIVIDVPVENVYDVVADFAKYPEFLPEVQKADVTQDGPAVLCTYTVDLKATRICYTLKHTGTRPHKLEWSFIKGDVIKDNHGHWTLKDVGGRTEATYTIDLRLGAFVPAFVERALAEQSLPALLENFKKRAEKLHPKVA